MMIASGAKTATTPVIPELLAPAGSIEAGCAALQYGADAIYLGLPRFSARAEAANCSVDELGTLTAYAHSLRPRRKVYLALNTLVMDGELKDAIDELAQAACAGVDAVIVQDIGIARIARRCFPSLALHASTQMAIHSVEGARTLHRLGFNRVTLARELTLPEIKRIVGGAGLEVEFFVQGALCYSFSGLCLFSSHLRGRSGNRGRCAYPCREGFAPADADWKKNGPARFWFSMKDLSLTEHVDALQRAGVTAIKIEGRKKSPLYVAAATTLYRGLLDGKLDDLQRGELEADLRAVFSRPGTSLYLTSRRARGITDTETVGHRGVAIGKVDAVTKNASGDCLRFITQRRLELHDGLQIDLPGGGRPYGFAVDEMWANSVSKKTERVFEVAAATPVTVRLPSDHPVIPDGAPVYCSSSQEVKQKYDIRKPRIDEYRVRLPTAFTVTLTPEHCRLHATVRDVWPGAEPLVILCGFPGPFPPATKPASLMMASLHAAFDRLGRTSLSLDTLTVDNPANCFVPVSTLNEWRRNIVQAIETAVVEFRTAHLAELQKNVSTLQVDVDSDTTLKHIQKSISAGKDSTAASPWSIKVDRLEFLHDFPVEALVRLDEIIVDISLEPMDTLLTGLRDLAAIVGNDRIRLALPMIMRKHESSELKAKAGCLADAGWCRWEAANLAAWDILRFGDLCKEIDLAADWSLYVLNRQAAAGLVELGVNRITLSPEDTLSNMTVLSHFRGARIVTIVYQDSPLFISETCPRNEAADCRRGKTRCEEPMHLVSEHGDEVEVITRNCRAITIGRRPFCIASHLDALSRAGLHLYRADFLYRQYVKADVWRIWQALLNGGAGIAGHEGNFRRGLM